MLILSDQYPKSIELEKLEDSTNDISCDKIVDVFQHYGIIVCKTL